MWASTGDARTEVTATDKNDSCKTNANIATIRIPIQLLYHSNNQSTKFILYIERHRILFVVTSLIDATASITLHLSQTTSLLDHKNTNAVWPRQTNYVSSFFSGRCMWTRSLKPMDQACKQGVVQACYVKITSGQKTPIPRDHCHAGVSISPALHLQCNEGCATAGLESLAPGTSQNFPVKYQNTE